MSDISKTAGHADIKKVMGFYGSVPMQPKEHNRVLNYPPKKDKTIKEK